MKAAPTVKPESVRLNLSVIDEEEDYVRTYDLVSVTAYRLLTFSNQTFRASVSSSHDETTDESHLSAGSPPPLKAGCRLCY